MIEAIVEEPAPKAALFAELHALCRPEAILATNTSALSVTADRGGERPARSASSACTSSTRRR